MDNQSIKIRLDLLAPSAYPTPITVTWKTADKQELRLADLTTAHLLNISRQIVNAWGYPLGVQPLEREADPRYRRRNLNIEDATMSWFLVQLRIFTLEIFRRIEGGEVLADETAAGWERLKQKIEACLDAQEKVAMRRSIQHVNNLFDAEFPSEAQALREAHR